MTNQNMDSFLIVASPRSGSNYLCYLLDAQPEIKCYLELFHPEDVPLRIFRWTNTGFKLRPKERDLNPESYLNYVFRRRSFFLPRKPIVGGKLLLCEHQIKYGAEALFKRVNKIIFLERKNKLAWYASLKKAEKTGEWFTKPSAESNFSIQFEQRELAGHIEREKMLFNKVIQNISLTRHQFIHLYYEDLQSQPILDLISEFLGVAKIHRPKNMAWESVGQYLSVFSNLSDVSAYMKRVEPEFSV
jgi:LPS sulfotransferase NodH